MRSELSFLKLEFILLWSSGRKCKIFAHKSLNLCLLLLVHAIWAYCSQGEAKWYKKWIQVLGLCPWMKVGGGEVGRGVNESKQNWNESLAGLAAGHFVPGHGVSWVVMASSPWVCSDAVIRFSWPFCESALRSHLKQDAPIFSGPPWIDWHCISGTNSQWS